LLVNCTGRGSAIRSRYRLGDSNLDSGDDKKLANRGGSNSSRSKLRKKKQALVGVLRIELSLN
jgi:hypothetical protein